jgi:DNA-binding response OmpR family regulator
VIEDDQTVSELLAYNLRRVGYNVSLALSGPEGLEMALAQDYDLLLVDLMLPGIDGLTVAQTVAGTRPGTPFIVVSARDERETILQAFSKGADDFVTKPFDFDLLVARIEASLNRHKPASVDLRRADSTTWLQETNLDRDARLLRASGGEVPLNRKEYALLELFFMEPGHLFAKEEIVERIWHHRYLPGSRTLDAHITRVRAKLAFVKADVSIKNVRRVGYRLAPASESED